MVEHYEALEKINGQLDNLRQKRSELKAWLSEVEGVKTKLEDTEAQIRLLEAQQKKLQQEVSDSYTSPEGER